MNCLICNKASCRHWLHPMSLQNRYRPAINAMILSKKLAKQIDDELEAEARAEEDKMEVTK